MEEHPEAVDAFPGPYGDSISFMSDEGNRSEAAALVAKYGITANAQIARPPSPQCNLTPASPGRRVQDTVRPTTRSSTAPTPPLSAAASPYDCLYYGVS